MSEAVLDSSAVLAVLFDEPGAERVLPDLPDALLSAVNFAEVVSKLFERGMPRDEAAAAVAALGVAIVDFEAEQALLTGELRLATRALGLSLGDRACLALARQRGLRVVTADAAWMKLEGFRVESIRG